MKIFILALTLLTFSSCNIFQLTTGKANLLTGVSQTNLLMAINDFRASNTTCTKAGVTTTYTPGTLSAYTWSIKLETAALSHANFLEQRNKNIAVGDPHNGAGDASVGVRLQAAGFMGNTYGENIGAGQPTIDTLIEAFRVSTNGHCNNLMDSDFTQVGAAFIFDDDVAGVKKYDNYWVLDFGKN
jgi:uncharacterized protein YkwD